MIRGYDRTPQGQYRWLRSREPGIRLTGFTWEATGIQWTKYALYNFPRQEGISQNVSRHIPIWPDPVGYCAVGFVRIILTPPCRDPERKAPRVSSWVGSFTRSSDSCCQLCTIHAWYQPGRRSRQSGCGCTQETQRLGQVTPAIKVCRAFSYLVPCIRGLHGPGEEIVGWSWGSFLQS